MTEEYFRAQKLLDIYEQSLRIRMVEQRIANEYQKQEIRCPVHLSLGQEINAVILCKHIKPTDMMVSTHRGHAHYLAKGGSLNALISELYGKSTGCSGGLGGSMHLTDRDFGFMGSTSIVGGTVPIGVGLGFGHILGLHDIITIICIGDAVIEQGVFFESYNFACLHKLPIIFYCENNKYSCYTHIKDRQPNNVIGDSYKFQRYFHFHSPFEQLEDFKKLIYTTRTEPYPCFIEIPTWRFVEHCGPNNDDHFGYRKEDVPNDPLLELEQKLPKFSKSEMEYKINQEIDKAFELAKKSPFPQKTKLYAN